MQRVWLTACYNRCMDLRDIIEKVAAELKSAPYIHAMWIEGSYATGKNNEKSDVDVWMDVDDGTFDKSIDLFREELLKIVEVDEEESRGIYSHEPKLTKQTFFLKNYPRDNCIELDLQEHSRNFVFSKDEHSIIVLFDKDNTIRWS